MTTIGFIGLGNMGAGMAANLVKAGHDVLAFDLSAVALDKARASGCRAAASAEGATAGADVVITMLPAGAHVRQVWTNAVIPHAKPGTLLIDCSTIDVDSARAVSTAAVGAGLKAADAPVSGGIMAAEAGTLAFMVGCDDDQFAAPDAWMRLAGLAPFVGYGLSHRDFLPFEQITLLAPKRGACRM